MRRILIFAHYDFQNSISPYVLFLLNKVRPLFHRRIIISNSNISDELVFELAKTGDEVIQRPNKGFDFAAWRDGLFHIGWETLRSYDSLTLMNNTFFGPFNDLGQIYEKMESRALDFWGMTDFYRDSGMPTTGGPIPRHLQSYFLVFHRTALEATVFRMFWEEVIDHTDVLKVIRNYEVPLTSYFTDRGFKYECCFPFEEISKEIKNTIPIYSNPDLLLKQGLPIIKTKAFIHFAHPVYLKSLIRNYPIQLIDDNFSKSFTPNVSSRIVNKNLIVGLNEGNGRNHKALRIAIHVHAYYPEIFGQFLPWLSMKHMGADVYVTTDSEVKREQLLEAVRQAPDPVNLKGVFIFENIGRDIYPWLSIHDLLESYDIVGHFHTKKSPTVQSWIGESWLHELQRSLLGFPCEIFDAFKDPSIGIIIPDIPLYFKSIDAGILWGRAKDCIKKLWTRFHLRPIDWDSLGWPIFPIGTMFWYRPAALAPLFKLGLRKEDFPPEPIGTGGTILHAIERLPVYIAWASGYDYRVAIPIDFIQSGFDRFLYMPTEVSKGRQSLYKSIMRRVWKHIPIKIKMKIKRWLHGIR